MAQLLSQDCRKRREAYLHPSWLASYVSGEKQCELGLFLQAQFILPKQKTSFDLANYKQKQALLKKISQDYQNWGYQTFVEEANEYQIKSKSGATISCRPDLVAIKDDKAIVVDVKTGGVKLKDYAQVQLYMSTIPIAALHGIQSIPHGEIIYQDCGSSEITPSEITTEWQSEVAKLIQVASGSKMPKPNPSISECCYCSAASVCISKKTEHIKAATADWL